MLRLLQAPEQGFSCRLCMLRYVLDIVKTNCCDSPSCSARRGDVRSVVRMLLIYVSADAAGRSPWGTVVPWQSRYLRRSFVAPSVQHRALGG